MRHVALLIETSRTYGRELLRGVRRYISEHGPWSVFVELRALESKPPPWLKTWQGDGILVRTGSPAIAQAVKAANVPAVELRSTRLQLGLPFVGVDNQALGKMVAAHFLERGFHHFGFYEIVSEDYFEQRRDQFVATLKEAGFDCSLFRTPGSRERPAEWEKQQAKLTQWLQQLPKPVAIMACTDQLGFWLLDACKRAQLSVPEDVAIVGVENDESLCTMATPPLSSVPLGGEAIGYRAANILDDIMEGKSAPKQPVLIAPPDLVTRQSSDIVAIEDAELSQAVRFIRRQATSGISVDDILQEVPISRSSLERKMRAFLGRSPNDEINRVRLLHVKKLLRETDLSIEQIAHLCGFRHAQYLSELFKKNFAKTPRDYRVSEG